MSVRRTTITPNSQAQRLQEVITPGDSARRMLTDAEQDSPQTKDDGIKKSSLISHLEVEDNKLGQERLTI